VIRCEVIILFCYLDKRFSCHTFFANIYIYIYIYILMLDHVLLKRILVPNVFFFFSGLKSSTIICLKYKKFKQVIVKDYL